MSTHVGVTLGDFFVTLGANGARAGAITFGASNQGAVPHELLVIRTDLPEDQLPQSGGAVDEKAVNVVGSITNIPSGAQQGLSLNLAAGRYVLICNIRGHYASGMHAAFTVSP